VRVVVWLLDFRVNKLFAVWDPATIIREALFTRMSPRRPGGAHLTQGAIKEEYAKEEEDGHCLV